MPYYIPQQLTGELIGPLQIPVVPGHGVMVSAGAVELDELPAPTPGHVWVWRDGQAVELADHRGTYYRTDTGERVEHTELGELPDGLAHEPRPGPHHDYVDGGWVLNESRQQVAEQAAERAWRDMQIMSVEWMRDRHRDQLEIGAPTTLTAEQYQELLQYMQDLRDWPQAAEFPAQEYRPQPPEWLAGQLTSAA